MASEFALVEDGTRRAVLFLSDGLTRVRLQDGSWSSRWPSADEVVTPEELRAFRAASRGELSALVEEVRALAAGASGRAGAA